MSILLSSADTVLPGVNPSRIPGGLDVRESLPAAEQELCFLLTSPFIEPARGIGTYRLLLQGVYSTYRRRAAESIRTRLLARTARVLNYCVSARRRQMFQTSLTAGSSFDFLGSGPVTALTRLDSRRFRPLSALHCSIVAALFRSFATSQSRPLLFRPPGTR